MLALASLLSMGKTKTTFATPTVFQSSPGFTIPMGRDMLILDNGNIVCGGYNTSLYGNYFAVLISTNKGSSFSLLTKLANNAECKMVGFNNKIFAYCNNNLYVIDPANPEAIATPRKSTVFGHGGYIDHVDMCIKSETEFAIVICAVSSTYPSNRNLIFSRTTDGGFTWIKMDGTSGYDFVTTHNQANYYAYRPSIAYASNGNPVIAAQWVYSTNNNYYIMGYKYTTYWGGTLLCPGDTGVLRQEPNIIVRSAAPNLGRIEIVWKYRVGSYDRVAYCYSDDLFATYSSLEILNSGKSYSDVDPIIMIDSNGDSVVVCKTTSSVYPAYCKRVGGTWGAMNQLSKSCYENAACAKNFKDFTIPPILFRDGNTNEMNIFGDWTV